MHLYTLFARKKYARAVAGGAVALAASGIVLLRAERNAAEDPAALTTPVMNAESPATGAPSAQFTGPAAHGRIALSQGAVSANGEQHVFAEIRVEADRAQTGSAPRPVALAVVLDVSGSMSGDKLAQAKSSVLQLIERMRGEDQISLVTYADSVRVVQALAPVSQVRDALRVTIPTIQIEGGTNIPAGLAAGASTLALAQAGVVRRIVLVSDGQDTSGRALNDVRTEVRGRADQGITVSTLGIGTDYSDWYMTALADAGRGNYAFLRNGSELAGFLTRELDQANNTTVERATAEVTLPAGWRIDRVIGADTAARTGTVSLPIGALFAGDERRIVLDMVVPPSAIGTAYSLGFRAGWHAVSTQQDVRVGQGQLAVRVVGSEREALASRDTTVFAESQSAVLALRQREAVDAWRSGDIARAQTIAASNIAALNRLSAAAPAAAPALERQARAYADDQSAFGTISAQSESGRAFGLSSNVRHRAAALRRAAY